MEASVLARQDFMMTMENAQPALKAVKAALQPLSAQPALLVQSPMEMDLAHAKKGT